MGRGRGFSSLGALLALEVRFVVEGFGSQGALGVARRLGGLFSARVPRVAVPHPGTSRKTKKPASAKALTGSPEMQSTNQTTATGILPIRACHSRGPVMCAEVPPESTATVTGMSTTSNS